MLALSLYIIRKYFQENGKGFAEFSGTLRNSSANCLQFGRENSEDFTSVIVFHSSSAVSNSDQSSFAINSVVNIVSSHNYGGDNKQVFKLSTFCV